jgi:threonine synthase
VKHQLLLEPHGAVAWRGFQDWLETEPYDGPAVVLETANPAKFPEELEKLFNWSPDIPPAMAEALKLPENFDRIGADYENFKAYLLAQHA